MRRPLHFTDVFRDFDATSFGVMVTAFLFASTGPVAIILAAGAKGGLDEATLSSWIFGVFFVNGLLSIGFCLWFRQPLVFLWTIPGAILVGPALTQSSFPEVVGAFVATGLLMAVIGVTGVARRIMDLLPGPIVMAMVTGVYLQFGLDWIGAFRDELTLTIVMTAAFVAASLAPRFTLRLPPVFFSVLAGALMIALSDAGSEFTLGDAVFAAPILITPEFSLRAMLDLVIPITVTVLIVQNGQGFAVLRAKGHKPPVNAVAVACGVTSVLVAFVGSVSTCLTGPTNAIIASEGPPERHYAAAVGVGALVVLFGLFAPLFTGAMLAAPAAFIATLAGLSMLKVLQGSFIAAFAGPYSMGAVITFLVTVADIPIFGVGAAFWGLVFGGLASRLLEPADWRS